MSDEKSFQSYFLSKSNAYRTSLTNGSGFPDCIACCKDGLRVNFVELKVLRVGVSGDKKLRGLFEDTQIPWYAEHVIKKGCKNLYVLFSLNKGYGLLKVNKHFIMDINDLYYSVIKRASNTYQYKEYKFLKEVIRILEA